MKKTLFFAVLALAFVAFGFHTGTVHAQTTSAAPSDTATLEQELDVAKATLINLQMQEGVIPQGDNGLGGAVLGTQTTGGTAVSAGLSATEVSYFDGVLSQLVSSLSELNATLEANPDMNQVQLSAIASTLGSMQGTVSSMATQIAEDENAGSQVATTVTTPSKTTGGTTASAGNGGTAVTSPATTQATGIATGTALGAAAATATSTPVQTTAQASSIWSFTKKNWPVVVIIVLVIAILAILFWPEEAKAPVQPVQTASAGKTNTSANTTGAVAAHSTAAPVQAATDQGTQKTA